jgi:hypothetical protein
MTKGRQHPGRGGSAREDPSNEPTRKLRARGKPPEEDDEETLELTPLGRGGEPPKARAPLGKTPDGGGLGDDDLEEEEDDDELDDEGELDEDLEDEDLDDEMEEMEDLEDLEAEGDGDQEDEEEDDEEV